MKTLAVVSGASRREVDRTPGRVVGFLRSLGELGPVDVVVVHDQAVPVQRRRDWGAANLVAVASDGASGATGRILEVAATPPKRSGMVREVHLHRSDAPEREARRTAWFRVVETFVASAAGAHDVVWCADLVALRRAGWIRPALPAVVDIDRFEDLGSARARRSARLLASVAHLVTMDSAERRDQLGLPGSIVAAPDQSAFDEAIHAVVTRAAAYRPARTS